MAETIEDAYIELYGGIPPPGIEDLAREVSFEIQKIVSDPDLYYRHPRLDLVTLVTQEVLMKFAACVIRIDRLSPGPNSFSMEEQTFQYRPREPKPEPPLRSWVRKNGHTNGRANGKTSGKG